MKTPFLLSLSALLIFTSCQTAINEPINSIQAAVEAGSHLTVSKTVENITSEGIHSEQIGTVYNLGEALSFAFVNEPNAWTSLLQTQEWEKEGHTAWSGLLIKKLGENWTPFFEIPEENFNPVNLVLEGKDLFLDVADDSGAGSGEGQLHRYVYSLGDENFTPFYTWIKLNCNGYYIRQTYKYEAFSCI